MVPRQRRRWAPVLFALAGIVYAREPASADTGQRGSGVDGDALLREGAELARAGSLARAIPVFRRAYLVSGRAIALCNLGQAYGEQGAWHRANLLLRACARAWPRSEAAPVDPRVEEAIVRTRRELSAGNYGALVLEAGSGVTEVTAPGAFDRRDRLPTNQRVWFPVGRHDIVTRYAAGERRVDRVVIRAGDTTRLALRRVEAGPRSPGETRSQDAAASPSHSGRVSRLELARPPAPPGTARGRRDVLGWSLLGAGAVSIAGGAAFHLAAAHSRRRARGLEPGEQYEAAASQFVYRRAVAVGAYAAGTVLVGIAAIRLLAPASDEAGVRVGAAPTRGGAMSSLVWTF